MRRVPDIREVQCSRDMGKDIASRPTAFALPPNTVLRHENASYPTTNDALDFTKEGASFGRDARGVASYR